MATPDIGTTISDGYSRGIERLSSTIGSSAVAAGIVGVVAGIVQELQARATGVSFSDFGSMFRVSTSLEGSDMAVFNLLAAVSTLVELVVGFAALAIFAGAMHRARHGASEEIPEPGAMTGALSSMARLLMPKLGVLAALSVAGPLAGTVFNVLGGLVSLVTAIALTIFSVRWIYAPVIIGSGEAEGDAGYERSEATVAGDWWKTFGVLIVVGLAIGLPIAIVASVVGAILPTVFLSAFATAAIGALGYYSLGAAALDSAWAQVESAPVDAGATSMPPTGVAPVVPAVPDAVSPDVPTDNPPHHQGPFS